MMGGVKTLRVQKRKGKETQVCETAVLTGMNQWCRPLDVQGQDSRTDAARSHSCRTVDMRDGELRKRIKYIFHG